MPKLNENPLNPFSGYGGIQAYSEQYKEKCFISWYSNNRPKGNGIRAVMPEDELGRVPNLDVIRRWMKHYDWSGRANEMDKLVQQEVQKTAIAEKVKMLQRHAEVSFEMINIGFDYIKENGAESTSNAVRLITEGVKIERESRGLSDAIAKISQMDDDKLDHTISQLLSRLTNEELEELEEKLPEESETIDGEATEIGLEDDDTAETEEE